MRRVAHSMLVVRVSRATHSGIQQPLIYAEKILYRSCFVRHAPRVHAAPASASRTAKVVRVVVVLTLTHRYNAVRGHRTSSDNSGVEDYPRWSTSTNSQFVSTPGTWYIPLGLANIFQLLVPLGLARTRLFQLQVLELLGLGRTQSFQVLVPLGQGRPQSFQLLVTLALAITDNSVISASRTLGTSEDSVISVPGSLETGSLGSPKSQVGESLASHWYWYSDDPWDCCG